MADCIVRILTEPDLARQHGPLASALVHGSDLFLRSAVARAALRPELVLHLGRMPTSKTLFTWLQQLEDEDVNVVHLSTDGQAHSLGHSPQVVTTSWPQLRLSCREDSSTVRDGSDWLQQWQDAERLTLAAIDDASRDAGLWEGSAARVVSGMPAGSTLVLGSGMPVRLDGGAGCRHAGATAYGRPGVSARRRLAGRGRGAAEPRDRRDQ